MKQLVIACSLSTTSKSAVLAAHLVELLSALDVDTELIDLRKFPLPFCDAGECYADPNVVELSRKITDASAVTLAVPIYNYDVGGAARNLIAVTGSAWNEQVVGFVGAAGGQRSYMSLMPLANSLMLDFRSVIVPRYVYASRNSFVEGKLQDPTIEERLAALASDLKRFATGLRG